MSKNSRQKYDYVKVALYDAEKKKTIGKTINRANFKSERELKKYIDKLKEDQKEKNKKVKEQTLEKTAEKIVTMSNNTMNNIDNFILDEGTGNSTVILGSSKRGKSTLMMHLYKKFYMDDPNFLSTLFSGNHHIDVYKNYKNLLIGDGFNTQSEKYVKLEKYINSKTKNKYDFLNLFDDIIDLKYKKLVNNLILTYRNANISTIMCLQYGYLLSKMNRANVNNIIIFGCNSAEAKKDMIELYLKPFFLNKGLESYKEQSNYFDEVTNDYGFFYINNIRNSFSTHRLKKS